MKFGLAWQGASFAEEAEQAGIQAFCAGDFVDHDAYVSLTEMAHNTTDARIGTAIAYAFARTPFAHAAALRQLAKISGEDRLFVGLGTGAFTVNRDWFGVSAEKPMARMAEVIQVIRAYLSAENGETISFGGEYYKVSADIAAPVLGRIDVPIFVGAFNSGMARMSGRLAEGVIGHGLFTTRWWDEVIRPNVAAGRAAVSRTEKAQEYGWLITAINDDDPAAAIRDARRMIAFYLTVATYDKLADLEGWKAEVDAIRTAYKQRDPDGMVAAVSDAMLEKIAVCGDTAQAKEMLRARSGGLAGDTVFLAPPSYLVSDRRKKTYARAAFALIEQSRE